MIYYCFFAFKQNAIFSPILQMLSKKCKDLSLLKPEVHQYLEIVLFFVKHRELAEVGVLEQEHVTS